MTSSQVGLRILKLPVFVLVPREAISSHLPRALQVGLDFWNGLKNGSLGKDRPSVSQTSPPHQKTWNFTGTRGPFKRDNCPNQDPCQVPCLLVGWWEGNLPFSRFALGCPSFSLSTSNKLSLSAALSLAQRPGSFLVCPSQGGFKGNQEVSHSVVPIRTC